jgi:nitrogen fixation/metabolism regulation signal transduction histidine kinase
VLRPTIRNKLVGGFGALLLLMAVVAVIGCRAVLELRASALETARVGDRLDSISLEIQVHNLEAQQRINGYLANFKQVGADKARELYLDEAQFEIHEIQSLATKGVKIARTDEKKTKFHLIVQASSDYSDAVDAVVQSVESKSQVDANTLAKYQSTSQHLNETAEDGEMAGRDASQTSQDRIEQISKTSVPTVIGVSLLGLGIALVMSMILLRAILLPVDHLKEVAENVSLGNLSMNVRRFSDDEIGDLADSFSRMVTAVRFFQSEAEAATQAPSVPQTVQR